MNITVHRHIKNADPLVGRINQIGEEAGKLVSRRLGGRMPHVDVLITDSRGLANLIHQADIALGGTFAWRSRIINRIGIHWTARHAYAGTNLTNRGAIVGINATARSGGLGEFDRTLLHELAHAVQLNMPGARARHIEYLRTFTTHHPDMNIRRDYERLIDIREQQAENLEVLARHLPAPKGN